MTLQEKELLARFLQQLGEARAGQKDVEAEKLIQEACTRQPDAAYLLVQRALQLDQAFQATQAQAQKLQAELDQARISNPPASGGGFLADPNAWGSQPRAPAAVPQQAAPAAPTPQQAAAAPLARPSPWGGAGMLGTVATTAAGVVAGGFLYQGIQSLMHRNDPPSGAQKSQSAHAHEEDASDPQVALNDDAFDGSSAAGSDDPGGDFA